MATWASKDRTAAARLPMWIVAGTMVYLGTTWAFVSLVDFANLFGARDQWAAWSPDAPLVLDFFFREAGPTEALQWTLLAFTGAVCVKTALFAHSQQRSELSFTFFFGAGALLLLLLEDAVNIRHRFYHRVFAPLVLGASVPDHPIRNVMELTYYAVLGGLMLVFLVRVLPTALRTRRGKGYLALGYIAYASAALGSATRYLGGWYDSVGSWALERLAPGLQASSLATEVWAGRYHSMGFIFMDSFVEETLELMGAAGLSAAVLALSLRLRADTSGDIPQTEQAVVTQGRDPRQRTEPAADSHGEAEND